MSIARITRSSSLIVALFLSLAPAYAEKKQPVSDGGIHDQVMIKLAGDSEVKGGAIDVEVHNGAVVLKGKVELEKQKQKAERLAKKVKGVTSVDNQLLVGPH